MDWHNLFGEADHHHHHDSGREEEHEEHQIDQHLHQIVRMLGVLLSQRPIIEGTVFIRTNDLGQQEVKLPMDQNITPGDDTAQKIDLTGIVVTDVDGDALPTPDGATVSPWSSSDPSILPITDGGDGSYKGTATTTLGAVTVSCTVSVPGLPDTVVSQTYNNVAGPAARVSVPLSDPTITPHDIGA